MLTIWNCGFDYSLSDRILDRIRLLVSDRKDCVWIVPEQETLTTEKNAAMVLPASAPLYFEVSNFSRLANRVFRTVGGLGEPYSDAAAKSLIMWRTLTELSPVLSKTYAKVTVGSVQKALSSLSQMQRYALTYQTLNGAAEEIRESNPRLAEKLSDMSLIAPLFRKLHDDHFSDVAEDIPKMCEKLLSDPTVFAGTVFFISGFTSFTEDQLNAVSLLLGRANVTVAFTLPEGQEGDFAFSEVRSAKKRLVSVANKNGVEIKTDSLKNNLPSPPELPFLLQHLWDFSSEFDNISLRFDEFIRVYKAYTPYEEADFVAADILRTIEKEKCSFRDFAIIAHDAEKYGGILDVAMRNAGIPVFYSLKEDLNSLEAMKLISTAYRIIHGGFHREDVILFTKCSLCGIARRDADLFEQYTDCWQIEGKRFTDGLPWNMNPDGYAVRLPEGADGLLQRVNGVRETLLSLLEPFAVDSTAASTVREQAEALLRFLLSMSMEDRLKEQALLLSEMGEKRLAEENAQLWKILCDTLDQTVEVMGDFPCNSEVFTALLTIAFSSVSIGHLPSVLDEVTVGSADMLRLEPKKHVYLFGVNAGEFPGTPGDDVFLTVADREILKTVGIDTDPDRDIRGGRELFSFSRAFCVGRKSVTLLFSEKSAAFAPVSPSPVISRIKELTGGQVQPISVASLAPSERISSPAAGMMLLGSLPPEQDLALRYAIRKQGFGDRLDAAERPIINRNMSLSPKTASDLYGQRFSLTQSSIEKYVNCPLNHFCLYGLHLKEEKTAEFDSSNVGSFVHSILENFFRELREENKRITDLTLDERREKVERHAQSYICKLADERLSRARESRMLQRLIRTTQTVVESLREEFENCRFEPTFFELHIHENRPGDPEPVLIPLKDGSSVFLNGIIDRVDTFRDNDRLFVRVIDYKTGNIAFNVSDLSEQKHLQMFLYMQSVLTTKNEEFLRRLGAKPGDSILPAGVIYVKTELEEKKIQSPSEIEKAADVRQPRFGMVLDDPVAIHAQNPDYLPVKFNQNGCYSSHSLSHIYQEEAWQTLFGEVKEGIVTIAERMKGGDIRAIPAKENGKKNACDLCSFRPVCRGVLTKIED